ncbi:hypothetical protein EJB05_01810, partial [Eragrostis curvula]
MAEAVVSSLVTETVTQAICLLTGQFKNKKSIKAKLWTIHHLVIKIQSVVDEAEARHITSQSLLIWFSELVNVTYQGRYMLDIFRYSIEASYNSDDDVDGNGHSFLVSSFNPAKRLRAVVDTTKTMFRNSDANELDLVLHKLQQISENLKEFIMLLGSHPPQVHRSISTNLFIDCQMFGRHVELEQIINFLLHEDGPSPQKLSILPVIGHTGVGKTTLVHRVSTDTRVRKYFSPIMLFKSYVPHFIESSIEWNSGDEAARVLTEKLDGNRFLLIFLNIDFQHMQQLNVRLPRLTAGKHGSRIIITSNNKYIANIGTVKPIILQCWFFFKAQAFESTDLEQNERLMALGRAIARKLKGSFYGAKVFGGFLRANPSPKFWSKVLNCDAWKLPLSGFGFINDIISHLLPPYLKKQHLAMTLILPDDCRTHVDLLNVCNQDRVDILSSQNKPKDGRNPTAMDIFRLTDLGLRG